MGNANDETIERSSSATLSDRPSREAAHVVSMVITAPSELDVISHRLDRIGRDSIRVDAIVTGEFDAPEQYRNRVITRLMESKMLLSAHVPSILDRIAALPLKDQPEQVAGSLRPITLAVEQANLAIARLRAIAQ